MLCAYVMALKATFDLTYREADLMTPVKMYAMHMLLYELFALPSLHIPPFSNNSILVIPISIVWELVAYG